MSDTYYDSMFPEKGNPDYWKNPVQDKQNPFYLQIHASIQTASNRIIESQKKKAFLPTISFPK